MCVMHAPVSHLWWEGLGVCWCVLPTGSGSHAPGPVRNPAPSRGTGQGEVGRLWPGIGGPASLATGTSLSQVVAGDEHLEVAGGLPRLLAFGGALASSLLFDYRPPVLKPYPQAPSPLSLTGQSRHQNISAFPLEKSWEVCLRLQHSSPHLCGLAGVCWDSEHSGASPPQLSSHSRMSPCSYRQPFPGTRTHPPTHADTLRHTPGFSSDVWRQDTATHARRCVSMR